MPRARSAILCTEPYFPAPESYPLKSLRTAFYARHPDYHFWFNEKLERVKSALEVQFPGEEFLCCTDAMPVPERELARRAGLGWIGKNGCLIHPERGSLFFIGEIYTSLELTESAPLPDHCGTCDRCIRGCPTEAIRGDRTLDARKCISYWTIEAKSAPPEHLRAKFGDWFFGCDICQTVCPWNEKVFGKDQMRAPQTRSNELDLETDLRWCLTASNREIEDALNDSPLSRARARGLRRNAILVVGNRKLRRLEPDVRKLGETFPNLRDLATWALNQLQND